MVAITKPVNLSLTWASDGDILDPGNTKYAIGWQVEIPPRQWFNFLDNRQDKALAHINQHGIAVWDSGTEYQANKSYVTGGNGKIYVAVTTNTNQDPTTDISETSWAELHKTGFVVFTTAGISSWTVPPILKMGIKKAEVQVIGGGGGGGSDIGAGSGGGGGGLSIKLVDLAGVTSVSVTVGHGGASALPGGSSSFGAFCSATGGNGSFATDLAAGGIGLGGDINDTLGAGFQRHASTVLGEKISGKGGGPGGGASIESGVISGKAGVGFGCGGGGGTGGAAGGAGKNGLVVIRW